VAHGAGGLDERGEPGALSPSAPPVEEFGGLVAVEVAGEDGPELLSFIS
jgi:hypothetical protein